MEDSYKETEIYFDEFRREMIENRGGYIREFYRHKSQAIFLEIYQPDNWEEEHTTCVKWYENIIKEFPPFIIDDDVMQMHLLSRFLEGYKNFNNQPNFYPYFKEILDKIQPIRKSINLLCVSFILFEIAFIIYILFN